MCITRRLVEDFKPWLAARPGQNKPGVTTATNQAGGGPDAGQEQQDGCRYEGGIQRFEVQSRLCPRP
jgi:hypothetical protein